MLIVGVAGATGESEELAESLSELRRPGLRTISLRGEDLSSVESHVFISARATKIRFLSLDDKGDKVRDDNNSLTI